MQECMRQKTEVNKSIKPSAYSIRKVMEDVVCSIQFCMCTITAEWTCNNKYFFCFFSHLHVCVADTGVSFDNQLGCKGPFLLPEEGPPSDS